MNTPDKIYLFENPIDNTPDYRWLSKRSCEDDVEYTRTDSFIEEACDFIKANIDHYIGHYLNDDDTYLDDSFIEDFKNYMKR